MLREGRLSTSPPKSKCEEEQLKEFFNFTISSFCSQAVQANSNFNIKNVP